MKTRWRYKGVKWSQVYFDGLADALFTGRGPFINGITAILLSGTDTTLPPAKCRTLQEVFDCLPEYDGAGYERQDVSGGVRGRSLYVNPIYFGRLTGGTIAGLLLATGDLPVTYMTDLLVEGDTMFASSDRLPFSPGGAELMFTWGKNPVFSWD